MARSSSTTKIKSHNDAFRSIGEQLRSAARKPNIYKYVPHEKQKTFHRSPARGRLFIGGNRSGKTVGGGVESVMWLRGEHPYRKIPPPPVRGRIVTTDFVQGFEKIVMPEIRRWLPTSDLINGSWEDSFDKTTRTLTLTNGSECEFLSYEQELQKFAGTSRHFVWFDEEPPKDIFTECGARLIDTGGDWWITMTPVDGLTWTFDDIYDSGNSNYCVVEIEMDENPHLNPEEIDNFFETMSDDDIKARRKGQYVAIGGFVYSSFLTDDNIIDPMIPPRDWMHLTGMDHGFTNPTAWLWGAVDRDGRMVIYHEYYASGRLINQHAKTILETNKELQRHPLYNVGDPSIRNIDPITGTSVHLEYLEHGVPIVLGNNDQKAGILRVSRYLQGRNIKLEDGTEKKIPQLYITRDNVELLREMKKLRWATWKSKKDRYEKNNKEEQKKKDDHACDALRYLVSSRPDGDTGEFVPPSPVYREATEAIPHNTPYIDREISEGAKRNTNDFHLGDEW
jgi:phage terminase large subunit-like protein